MHIDVIANVGETRMIDLANRTVIVIDVLRATSTIITALAHGATGVVPVETVGQAKQCSTAEDLLGGERYCKKITGFHAGNSPFEYTGDHIAGKRIVMTTTNGTRAIQKAARADHILAGSFINARACAQAAVSLRKDIALLCAGTQDTFALEDGLCAGLLVHELMQTAPLPSSTVTANDLGTTLLSAYLYHEHNLLHVLSNCASGKRLIKLGFERDIAYCASINTVPLVPYFNHQMMVPLDTAMMHAM